MLFALDAIGVPSGSLVEVLALSRNLSGSGALMHSLARWFFFASVMRNAFVMIILTLASFLYCRNKRGADGKYPIRVLLTVPSGFKHVRSPNVEVDLLSALAAKLPVATIILLLEHIAIAKCTCNHP